MWQIFCDAPYGPILQQQLALREEVAAGRCGAQVLLGTHRPVITFGKRGKENDLRVSRQCLAQQGIEVFQIDRGGELTYHGPGQIVTYPIVPLARLGLGVRRFVEGLEEAMIRTLAHFGLRGQRQPGHPGVFLEEQKIGSLGIHVRRGVTTHGTALNINTRLEHFRFLNPCGLAPERMTSAAAALGRELDMEEALAAYRQSFEAVFPALKESR